MQITMTEANEDSEWDQYIAHHPFGHHEQSCGFAKIRKQHKFNCLRIIARQQGSIVGGVQILARKTPFGVFAMASQGPIFDHERVAQGLLSVMDEKISLSGINKLRITAYGTQENINPLCSQLGFNNSNYSWFDGYSSAIDLTLDQEQLIKDMQKTVQYNIGYAEKHGVVVDKGDEADLVDFHRMLSATSAYKKFPVLPYEYFTYLWRLFGKKEKLELLLARYQGKTVAAHITTFLGDRAYAGWGGIERTKPDVKANHFLVWQMIKQAQDKKYKWFDMGGISEDSHDSLTEFKKSFGGTTIRYPDAIDKFYGSASSIKRSIYHLGWNMKWVRNKIYSYEDRTYGRLAY